MGQNDVRTVHVHKDVFVVVNGQQMMYDVYVKSSMMEENVNKAKGDPATIRGAERLHNAREPHRVEKN